MTTFADAALIYLTAGWKTIIPIPPGTKWPPPTGTTGEHATDPTAEQLDAWRQTNPHHNTALRLPAGIIGIDIDNYGDKPGAATITEHETRLGPLPPTWTTTSRTDGKSGIRLYQIPAGARLPGTLGPGVEIIQRHHRYALVWPSIHPNGDQYRWISPEGEPTDHPPEPDELTQLPWPWIETLIERPTPPTTTTTNEPQTAPPGPWTPAVTRAYTNAADTIHGNRHDTATAAALALTRLRYLGHPGADDALTQLRDLFIHTVTKDGTRDTETAAKEWNRIVTTADTKTANTPATAPNWQPDIDLADLIATTAAQTAAAYTTNTDTADDWQPHNLTPHIDGTHQPETPTILPVDHHGGLIYPNRVNAIFGEPGGGKSWTAVHAAAQTIAQNHHVLIIDYEDTPSSWVRRLIATGTHPHRIATHVHYIAPLSPYNPAADQTIDQLVADHPIRLAVIDSAGEALATEHADPNSDDAVARWFRRFAKRIAAKGVAVLLIDHVPKNPEGPRRYAIGSQRKLAAIDGAAYRLDVIAGFSKDKPGRLKLTVAKDRHGARPPGAAAAEITITPTNDAGIIIDLHPPPDTTGDDGQRRLTGYMERVSRWLEDHDGPAIKAQIKSGGLGKTGYVLEALDSLVADSYVAAETETRGGISRTTYTSMKPYRESYPQASFPPFPTVPAPFRNDAPGDDESTVSTVPGIRNVCRNGNDAHDPEPPQTPGAPFPDDNPLWHT